MLKYFAFLYPQGESGKFEVVCGWGIIRVELFKGCKEAMEKNTKNALIKTYAIGMFIQTLLDEWSRVERIGTPTKVYALDEAIFRKLNSKSCGVTLASCKVARLLSEKLQEYIEKEGEIKSIY